MKGLGHLLSTLRRNRYDLVIDLHGQFRSARSYGDGAPTRIGFDRPRKHSRNPSDRRLVKSAYVHGWTGTREGAWMAYTHRIAIPALDVHAVDRYLGWPPSSALTTARRISVFPYLKTRKLA